MKKTAIINNITVDLESIFSIKHKCHKGACKINTCCCSNYEICITGDELSIIIGCLPEASKFSKYLWSNDGYENVFEQIETDLFCIDTTEEGTCVFAYNERGKILCSLHSAALKLGLPAYKVKPRVCVLWPLAILEGKSIRLTIQDDAFTFGCNTRKDDDNPYLCSSIAKIIDSIFGKKFREQLESRYNS